MANPKTQRLAKVLKFRDVYAIAAGTTLSAGFFLLPGLAVREAGSAMTLAYIIAVIPLIPAMFSISELATAMPRAGGVYYFLDRTMGPLVGAVGGLGTWLALILKVAFALIGMGAYIRLLMADFGVSGAALPMTEIAICIAIALGLLNYFGARRTGSLQRVLLYGLIAILAFFLGGMAEIRIEHFNDFMGEGFSNLLSTAGMVYISYVGITKVASLSEEVENPERNLPRGIFLALGTAIVVYVGGTIVMVGVVPIEELSGNLTPAALAAENVFGWWGKALISLAALLAFTSVANAGILSASRYPLAMSRDHILPRFLRHIGSTGAPTYAIILTLSIILAILILLDPTKIAKLASAFQLLMFALVCLAVIVMRESRIESYDPGYRSPMYPWMQIIGVVAPLILIAEMGWLPILFSTGLMILCGIWYQYYVRPKVAREGAIYHIFERLGKSRNDGIDRELRGILKEKGLRAGDPFDEIVAHSHVIDLNIPKSFEEIVENVSTILAPYIGHSEEEITTQLLEGTRIGATPVTHGVALPHLRVEGIAHAKLVLVRSKPGVHIIFNNPLSDHDREEQTVHTLFFLVSPEDDPAQHLRILAQIAERVDDDDFAEQWNSAEDEQDIKEVLLRDERMLSLVVQKGEKTEELIGRSLREIRLPEGCLVALLRRNGEIFVPSGKTVIHEGDRMTLIGNPDCMSELYRVYTKDERRVVQ